MSHNKIFEQALALHQRGQLQQAERLYREILTSEPDHADALHMMGVLAIQCGQPRLGAELIEKAIAREPGIPFFHSNIAEAYRQCGQIDRAIASYHLSLQLQPDNPDASNCLGSLLMHQGRAADAAAMFRRAVELRPEFALAHNNLANACRVLGDIEQAIAHFRRATELNPQLAFAHANLGQLLLECHRPMEALAPCREAVNLQPDFAPSLNNLGNVLRRLGHTSDARTCYARALQLSPNLAMIHNNLGQIAQEEGRLDEAARWYRQALQIEPNNPRFHTNLAGIFFEQNNEPAAEEHYQTALRHDPNYADAHLGLGKLRKERGRLAEARDLFASAIRLQPSHAMAHVNLGETLLELNQIDEAMTCFREALRHDPRNAPALGQLATHLRERMPEEEQKALSRLADDPNVSDGERTSLLFGLAHVCDARGEYDEAARRLERANDLELAFRRQRGEAYTHRAHANFITRTIELFTPEFFERVAGFGLDSERPVFVFGLPRSGTTLIEQVLASHPRVFGAGELRLGREDFEQLGRRPDGALDEALAFDSIAAIDADTVRGLAGSHLDRLAALNADAERITDKMPDNYLYVGFLSMLFPRARFIHCRRDLRDVAVSCWMTQFSHIPWANHPDDIALRFEQYQRLMAHWQRVLPSPMLEVDYEDTVNDLEGVARRLVAHCGLEWDPACLEFHRNTRPVHTASVVQVRQPIYRRSVQRWRNYESVLQSLFRRLEGGGDAPTSSDQDEMSAEALQV